MLTPKQVKRIVSDHDAYWDTQRSMLRDYLQMYSMNFWAGQSTRGENKGILMETEKGWKMVAGTLSALSSKIPAIRILPDLRAKGNAEVASAVVNKSLGRQTTTIQETMRLALIYGAAFQKQATREHVDPLRRVTHTALPPWEVILDVTTTDWDSMRWCGHKYQMPLDEAVERFGKDKSQFTCGPCVDWFAAKVNVGSMKSRAQSRLSGTDDSVVDPFVIIVEFYDIAGDRLVIWSPDYAKGESFLFEGISLPGDDGAKPETTGIPFKTSIGTAIVPITPFIPLPGVGRAFRGISMIGKSYTQLRQLVLFRTYQARNSKRTARVTLYHTEMITPEEVAKLVDPMDNELIGVKPKTPGDSLSNATSELPVPAIPPDLMEFAATLEQDISDAGLMAPFARGEATGVTATENSLMATYTASEIGSMARTRDDMLKQLALNELVMISVMLNDEAEVLTLPNPSGPTMLSADDLTGDFEIEVSDAGTTPMSDAVKRQTLSSLVPTLLQLGADPNELRAELVRVYQLPEALAKSAPKPEAPVTDGVSTPSEVA